MPSPERRRLGNDTPALVWRADAAGPRPALVSLHGGGHSKEIVGPATVERVVTAGVTLIAVDLHPHGEHFDAAAAALGVGYETTLEIVAHTAHDLHDVVAELRADAKIERDAIAVRGESLGAFAALTALGLGVPFSLGLSVAGAADYETTLTHALRAPGTAADDIAKERERLRARIREFDPIHRVDAIAPRPLLMIHGAADDAVPIDAHRAFHAALAPHYDAAGDCVFVTHAGGHETPETIDDLGWAWLLNRLAA
jgi:dipeptidyl aminopeptidase/acylaminoacyl peptidase